MVMALKETVTDNNSSVVNLSEVLTICKKPFNVQLTDKYLSWSYKKKQPFSEKERKTWTCKNRVPLEEVIAVEYVERQPRVSDGDIEMVSVNATSFRLHVVKRAPRHLWKVKSVELQCSSSTQCALWVDSIRSLLEKFTSRPKSLLVFINPFGGRRKARKVFDEKVAYVFDLAGITSHVIITERADHAKDYIMTHDLNRYDGVVCVGGDGMFSELLNGVLLQHNSRLGVDIHDPTVTLRKPRIRIGVIPAGSTDTVAYCTTGINDAVTSALHIVVGDSLSIDVCSVRHGLTSQLLRFCVSMLGYGFYGDVLKGSEELRWMGPSRYDYSGFRTFLRNRSYPATVSYLPSQALHVDHHPLMHGSRCFANCQICKSASDINMAAFAESLPRVESASAVNAEVEFDQLSDVTDSATEVSIPSRPVSSLSKVPPDSWQIVSGKFIGITALTISCRCSTVPEGVSPACHLGDGSTDLVLVHDTSRFNYLKHLIRISAKTASQFDFGFVDVVRTKAFTVRVPAGNTQSGDSASFQRLDNDRTTPVSVSSWNCDGEIIEEPNIDVRVHCQLVSLFARGIESSVNKLDQCTTSCISCSGIL